jgi:hypothetical protein
MSVRIIINDGNVRERKIQKPQIGDASPIPPDNHIAGDAMSTLPHAPCHPVKRCLGGRQPQIPSVNRQRSALHLRKMGTCVRPAQVVSNAKLARFLMSSRIRCNISRPAPNAACSGLNGDSPRAISSAFTNSRISRPCGTSNCAAVVFPAPLGPPMITISSTFSDFS